MPGHRAPLLIGTEPEHGSPDMNAADIMTRDVITVAPDTPVREVVKLLLARGISGVPVVDAARGVIGIVSEGDLLRRAELGTEKRRGAWSSFFTGTATLAADYVRAHGEVAGDIMTREVATVAPGTPVAEIADLMETRGIKRVPVVEGNALVGIVTRSNLLRAFASMAPEKPQGGAADDGAIRTALLAELAGQAWSRRSDNSVVVTDGVVHLWGVVDTRDEERAMELAAKRVPGVKAVQSHMIILAEEPYPLFPGALMS
jgi:CBS domain-containing protein